MVQHRFERNPGSPPEAVCSIVRAERRRFRSGQWGQHGEWKTLEAQKRYMKSDTENLLSVWRAAVGLPRTPALIVWIEFESAGAPPEMAEEGLPPDVVGVPDGSFTLS